MPALTAPARDRIPPPGPAAVLPAHPQPCPPPSLPPSPCDPSAPSGTRPSPAPPSAARSSTECRAACGTTFPPVSSAPLRPYSLAASGLPAPADVRPLPGTASDVMTPPCSPPPGRGAVRMRLAASLRSRAAMLLGSPGARECRAGGDLALEGDFPFSSRYRSARLC